MFANWKCNKTVDQAIAWLEEFECFLKTRSLTDVEFVICPPFPYLPVLSASIEKSCLDVSLASQTISDVSSGSFTGEVSAEMVTSWVKYSLIGHSEQRMSRKITDEKVADTVVLCQKSNISPVVCVSNLEQIKNLIKNSLVKRDGLLIAFEPLESISHDGNFNPADPDKVLDFINLAKEIVPDAEFIYGGSVNPDCFGSYLDIPLKGFLVGQSSLDPEIFYNLAAYAKDT